MTELSPSLRRQNIVMNNSWGLNETKSVFNRKGEIFAPKFFGFAIQNKSILPLSVNLHEHFKIFNWVHCDYTGVMPIFYFFVFTHIKKDMVLPSVYIHDKHLIKRRLKFISWTILFSVFDITNMCKFKQAPMMFWKIKERNFDSSL